MRFEVLEAKNTSAMVLWDETQLALQKVTTISE
jgi:hypothetical protein